MMFEIRKGALTTASIAALCAVQGMAPVKAAEADPVHTIDSDIIVTGTNIRGGGVIGSATQTLTSEDIARAGRATLAEVMRDLPANFAGGVAKDDGNRGGQDSSSGGSNMTGGTGINLRGLGALSTLVLVNGRRVAVSGQFGDFVDVANIPAAAIERVEVLLDGASAVYGSDAVGGVVNIVLKRNVEGLHVQGRVGGFTQGGEMEYQGSVVWGKNWSSGNVTVGYEYNHRDNVVANDRGFNGGDLSPYGGSNWPIYTSRAGTAANIFTGAASFNGIVAYSVPQGPGTGLTVSQLIPATGGMGNSFDPWEGYDIIPEMKRHSFFLSVDQDLGDRAHLYGNARYTHREGHYDLGYPTISGSLPATNPAYIPGVSNNFAVVVDDRLFGRDVAVDSYAADIGITYDLFADWRVDANLSYSREDQFRRADSAREGNVIEKLANGSAAPSSLACSLMGLNASNIGSIANPSAAQTFCAALNYEAFNPYSTQSLPAGVVDQLVGYERLKFKSDVIQGTVKADGTLINLPGGALKLAGGLDYRREQISGELDFNWRSINPAVVPYGATEQKVFAAFAEAAIPIVSRDNERPGVHALDFSAAIRYENSTGLKSFHTTNPKFGFRYAPTEGFNLRGSWGTSFHAPPMRFQYNGPQPVGGGNAVFYANSFYTAPCNTTMVELNGVTGIPGSATGECSFTGMVVSGGAGPTLKPETAKTWSLGIDLTPPPVPGLRIGFNYYNITVSDRLVRITSGALAGILSNYFATGTSPYSNNLDFSPDVAVVQSLFDDPRFVGLSGPGPTRSASEIKGIIYATQTNLATLKTSGIDLSASYDFDLGSLGHMQIFGNGTLVTNYEIEGSPGSGFVDRLGAYESVGNPVSFRSRQGFAFDNGPFSLVTIMNYTAPYRCLTGCFVPSANGTPVANTSPIRIGAWTTFDFQLGYTVESQGWSNGLAFRVNVVNAFDKAPPFIDTGRFTTGNAPETYDSANSIITGRNISLTVSKTF
ncbi:MAG: hypothetical protein DI568_01220 [Sphingomonas sp.]|nr:MAG: hypothetical protein DI568_01220 [Sphingomonas sp.]